MQCEADVVHLVEDAHKERGRTEAVRLAGADVNVPGLGDERVLGAAKVLVGEADRLVRDLVQLTVVSGWRWRLGRCMS